MCVCVCARGGGGLQGAWEDSTAVRHARQKFYNFTTPHFHPVKISTKILSSRVGLRTSRTVSTLSAGIHPGYIRIAYHFTRAKKKKKGCRSKHGQCASKPFALSVLRFSLGFRFLYRDRNVNIVSCRCLLRKATVSLESDRWLAVDAVAPDYP